MTVKRQAKIDFSNECECLVDYSDGDYQMKPEKIDNVNKPSHYQGSKGLESIEVIDNFIGNLPGKAAWCWGNAIKYLLRFQKKNGLEDLKKARKNLDWLIEEMEHGQEQSRVRSL